ncbi:MAG: lamin tail domain-containing protein [Saprospirales bacterium]|nr:lamin tail domain-containing protein [Saprospirales bacterium]
MKKITFSLLCFLALSLAGQAQIVITEIMFNPPPSGPDTLEYIELYNNSNVDVDISSWHFTEGVTFTFPPATTVAANSYVVVTENLPYLSARFAGLTAFQWTDGALTNSGEDIELTTTDSSQVIDLVDYTGVATNPLLNGGGSSLVLCDPNSDNSILSNWQPASTPTGVSIAGIQILANPGAAAACPSGVTALDDQVIAVSGATTAIPVLANDNLPGTASPTVAITVAPLHGSATVGANNTVQYTPAAGYCGADMLSYQVCENTDCDDGLVQITVRCYPAYTIDQINNINASGVADSINVYCELTATAYGVDLRPGGLQFTIIDDTNTGITVFSAAKDFGYSVAEKDKITIRGSINSFNGLLQILPDTLFKVSANNPLVTALVVQNHSEDTESKLIRINNLRYVNPPQWATGSGSGFSVFMVSDDHPLDTIQVRIDNDVDLFNQPPPPAPFNLTGIGGQFDSSNPYTTGYQIAPRYIPDVSTLVGAVEVDLSAHVRLSPNPATAWLVIQTDLPFDAMRIFNAQGQAVRSIQRPALQERIGLQELAAGTYFVRLEKDGAAWTAPFVKL